MSANTSDTKLTRIKRLQIGFNVIIQTILVLLILGLVNFASFHYFERWDVTREKTDKLSDKTLQVLKSLPEGIHIYALSSQRSQLGPEMDSLLNQIRYASDRKIQIDYIDTYVDFQRAQALQTKYAFDENTGVVIVVNKDKFKSIYPAEVYEFDNSGEVYGRPPRVTGYKGEQAMATALIEVAQSEQRKLYVVEGHGEYNVLGSEKYFTLKRIVETESIKLDKLRISDVPEVPADASALLIAGARFDFSEREIAILDEYWRKKGRLLVLLDPDSNTPQLNEFIGRTGISVQNNRVLGRRPSSEVKDLIVVDRYVIGSFVGTSPVTKNILRVGTRLPPPVQSLEINEKLAKSQNINVQPLLMTTVGFWGEVDYAAKDNDIMFDEGKDTQGPLILFAQAEKGAVGDQRVQLNSSRIMVTGTSAFADTRFLEGQSALVQFLASSLDWLTDREELIGVPPREIKRVKVRIEGANMARIFNTILLLPVLAAFLGVAVWWRRRN